MDNKQKIKFRFILDIVIWFLVILFFLFLGNIAKAQSFKLDTYVQHSVIGLQKGYAAKFLFKNSLGLGVFHQSSDNLSFETQNKNYPFTGLEIEFCIAKCENIQIIGAYKGGFVNEKFLVLVPEITTKIRLIEFVSLGLGTSYRAGQAAVAMKLVFQTK